MYAVSGLNVTVVQCNFAGIRYMCLS